MIGRLALGALASFALSAIHSAHAQDANWLVNTTDSNFNNPLNWSTGAVPTGIANFNTSALSSINFTAPTTIGGINIIDETQFFVFTNNVNGTSGSVDFVGNGISLAYLSRPSTLVLGGNGSIFNFRNAAATSGEIRITGVQGEIHFYDNSNGTNSNIYVSNNSTLTFHNNSVAGIIIVDGGSTVRFLDNSTWSSRGSASINDGTLYTPRSATTISSGMTLGATGNLILQANLSTGLIAGSGIVDLGSHNLTFTSVAPRPRAFSGVMQGTGSLDLTGQFDYTLSGTNTYTGTTTIGPNVKLNLGNASNTGSVAGDIINNGTLRLNRSDDYSFSNLISGVGQLIHSGTGNTTLTANNTYTGLTTINAGTLTINGSIASSSGVVVNSGGTLAGTGYVPGVTINAGGVLSPGTTSGTLHVSGNLTFQPSSLYAINVMPSNSTRTDVTGAAALDGAVSVAGVNANYGGVQRTTILHATGGISGTFTGVTSNLAFYDSALSYDANNVFLTLTRNMAASFSSNATTPNEQAVAAALDNANTNAALVQALQGLTVEQLQIALKLLSGEAFGSTPTVLLNDSSYLRNLIFSRLRSTTFTGTSGPLGYLSEQPEMALAYAPRAASPFAQMQPKRAPRYEFWAQGFGSWANLQGDNNAAGAKRTTGGMVSGVDKLFNENLRVGLAAGYSRTSVNVSDRASKITADTFHFAAYFSSLHNNWSYRSGVVGAVHNLNSERNVLGSTLKADYYAYTGQVFGEVGYGFTMRQVAFEPFANISGVYHRTGAFNETGGLGALSSQGDDRFAGFVTTGLRFATRYELPNGWALMPKAMLGWQHAIGPLATTSTLTFEDTGTAFTVRGVPGARDSLLAEAGFDVRISPTMTLGVSYLTATASQSTEHTARGKFEWRF